MSNLNCLVVILGIIFGGTIAVVAQEPPKSDPVDRERIERMQQRRERIGRRAPFGGQEGMHRLRARRIGRFLSELNLSEQQREQRRAIVQRQLAATKAQREELFQLREKRIAGTFSADDQARAKALHEQIRASRESARAEMEALLTAEQKAKLEEFKRDRKARLEERMKRRQELLKNKQ
jgi:Spy/CpxP family protein refolding chaperone